jgi:hypothetical protein
MGLKTTPRFWLALAVIPIIVLQAKDESKMKSELSLELLEFLADYSDEKGQLLDPESLEPMADLPENEIEQDCVLHSQSTIKQPMMNNGQANKDSGLESVQALSNTPSQPIANESVNSNEVDATITDICDQASNRHMTQPVKVTKHTLIKEKKNDV